MADYFGAAKDLIGGVSSFLGGEAESKTAQTAANTYAETARLSLASSQIKQAMVSRQIYQALGGISAAEGGAGLKQSGNALDLIRDSAQQGAIAKAVVGMQGEIDYTSYIAQSASEAAKAKSAKTGGFLGGLGGVVGALGSIF